MIIYNYYIQSYTHGQSISACNAHGYSHLGSLTRKCKTHAARCAPGRLIRITTPRFLFSMECLIRFISAKHCCQRPMRHCHRLLRMCHTVLVFLLVVLAWMFQSFCIIEPCYTLCCTIGCLPPLTLLLPPMKRNKSHTKVQEDQMED